MDALLKFTNRGAAIQFGKLLGFSRYDPESEEDVTSPLAGNLTIKVLGTFYKKVGPGEDPDGPESRPEKAAVDGWWVMVRAPDDYPVPLDKLRGNGAEIVWRSDDTDGEGNPVPYPDDPDIPKHRFL